MDRIEYLTKICNEVKSDSDDSFIIYVTKDI